jgi:hypothetical protein
MAFARTVVGLLILSLAASCVSDADAKKATDMLTQTILQTDTFSALAVRYRDEHGSWPTDPQAVRAEPDAPSDIDLQTFCDRVKLTPSARGLRVTEKTNGQTLFVIGNESSMKKVVLVDDKSGG